MKNYVLLCLVLLCWVQNSLSQTTNRVKIIHITPSEDTGQDYSPWYTDDLSQLVANAWINNNKWVDVTLRFEYKSAVSKLSFYDKEGSFADAPAYIYALNDTSMTYLGKFEGLAYLTFVDLVLPNTITADAIVVRKFGNNIPQKVQVFGDPIPGATKVLPPSNRLKIMGINPSEYTGQDYSPWLTDNLDSLVENAWTGNNKWVDIKLTLEHKSLISKLSLYDYTGTFVDDPVSIYALNDTTMTYLGKFEGLTYMNFVDIPVANPTITEAIIIRKFGNNIPQKVQIYGEAIAGTPKLVPPMEKLKVIGITPSENTGQDYAPWITDDINSVVQSVWEGNDKWVDIKLTLEHRSILSKLSFYDGSGTFTDKPASIYALNGTQLTFLGNFEGLSYNTFVDLVLSNPTVADAVIIRKFGNNIPLKVQVYGTIINGAVTPPPTNPNNPTIIGTKIPIVASRWYQLNNTSNGLDALFDGVTDVNVFTGWGKILDNFDAYYPLQAGESIHIQSVKFYDGTGTMENTPFKLYGITDQWERVLIATFTGATYMSWVGPDPNNQGVFTLANPPSANFRYLVINCNGAYPTEMELYGTYTAATGVTTTPPLKNIKMKDGFGINAFEWDFLKSTDASLIDESKMATFSAFSGFRQYMDWEKLEHYEDVYTYNPCFNGGWNYDIIYERCQQAGIVVLPCLQGAPNWMYNTYPAEDQDNNIVPVKYGKSFSDPNSYREQAQVAFQYVARYGSNPNVDTTLLSVFTQPRWTNDNVNTLKVGLGTIQYIECGNERDKWWKGRKAYQTAREYAANLSAFYDGHKNTMGPGIGAKNADPNIKVVMAGLASASPDYIRGMIDWCKEFRGYKPDGTVNLCWDVINYHLYSDNANSSQSGSSSRAAAPEVSIAGNVAKAFVKVAHEEAYDMPVWITELGFDINQGSPLKAIAIGDKPATITQADWGLRSALMYNRLGVEKSFFFMLYDDNPLNPVQFSSSGLINQDKSRRPIADYLYQTKNLIGDYVYKQTLSLDPLVDRYELNGKSAYILTIPDEIGRTGSYTLNLGNIHDIKIFTPKAGSEKMDSVSVSNSNGQFQIAVTETPIFVIPSEIGSQTAKTSQSILSGANYKLASGFDKLAESRNPELQTRAVVYPNPVSEVLYIMTDDISTIAQAKLQSANGSTVFETKNLSSNSIDLKAIPSGLYWLNISLKDGKHEIHKVSIVK
jgi:hypothetical protein